MRFSVAKITKQLYVTLCEDKKVSLQPNAKKKQKLQFKINCKWVLT